MIELRGVTKSYGASKVVDKITLDLASGLTSIVGPNGAGKSTLLSIMARLLIPDAGTISVDGLDTATAPGNQLAKRLAVLRQDNHITARLTVDELVAFGRFPHNQGRTGPGDRERIAQAIDYVGMAGMERRFLDELSGGQRQRAFIAMVLCQDTDHLLLDEPLNNLDMKNAVEMMKLLHRAATSLGKTVVMVLHDINFAASYSDRIIAMREGSVVFEGSPDELMQPDMLHEIYRMDIPVHSIKGRRYGLYYR